MAGLTPDEETRYQALAKKFGVDPDASATVPMPDLATELERSPVADFLIRAALPTLGGAAGIALGSRLPVVGQAVRRAAVPLAESGLSATGELLNQAFGLTPDSPEAIGLTAAFPLGARSVGFGANLLARRGIVPGSQGGLNEVLTQDATQVAQRLMVPENEIASRYAQARNSIDIVQTQSLTRALHGGGQDSIVVRWNKLTPNQRTGPIAAVLKDASDLEQAGAIDFSTLLERTQKLGRDLRADKFGDSTESGWARQIYKAQMDDLEQSSSAPGLHEAMSLFRRDQAADDLLDLLVRAKGRPRQGSGIEVLSAGKVLKELDSSPRADMIRKAVAKGDITRAEYADIVETLKAINRLAALPPARGQSFGFGQAGTTTAGFTGLGWAIEQVFGVEGAAKMGAYAGAAAAGMAFLLSRAMMTQPGRDYIKAVAKGGQYWSPQTIGLLSNIVRAGLAPSLVDPQQLPPKRPIEVQLPPVIDILPAEIDPSQLPKPSR